VGGIVEAGDVAHQRIKTKVRAAEVDVAAFSTSILRSSRRRKRRADARERDKKQAAPERQRVDRTCGPRAGPVH
jgi:hypothetical protein